MPTPQEIRPYFLGGLALGGALRFLSAARWTFALPRVFSKLSCAPLGGRLFPHQRLHRILHWACHCLRTLRGMLAAHFWKNGGWIGCQGKRRKLLPTEHLKFEMLFWLRIAFGWRLESQFWHRPPSLPRRLVGVKASSWGWCRHQSSVRHRKYEQQCHIRCWLTIWALPSTGTAPWKRCCSKTRHGWHPSVS